MRHGLADTIDPAPSPAAQGRATQITIDLDPIDDPTHGQQALTCFNGHYDTWCYLPVVATVNFDDEAERVRRGLAATGPCAGQRGDMENRLKELHHGLELDWRCRQNTRREEPDGLLSL